MNFFKTQFDRLGKQIATLNASQKMLAGALLAIMVMTLVMWGKYASSPEMEAVLDQAMAPDEIARIKDYLSARGYSPKVVGDRVMVAAERRLEAFSDLSFNQLLPRDTTSAFDVILSKMSPWDPASKTEVMWNQMKEMHLAQVMSSWPGVSQAHVMIDQKEKHGLAPSQPSATVDLRTRGGEPRGEKQLVAAAVALVRGAVSNIEPSKVSVIIDGVSRRVQDNSTGSFYGTDELSLRQEAETRYAENIRERLSYIEGLVVAVTADVNTKATREESVKYDPKNAVQKETKTNSKSEENSSSGTGGEPGAGANTQAQVAEGSSDKGKSSTNEETNEFRVEIGKVTTESTEGPGRATIKSATVGVPRSYIKRIYKELYPNDKDFVQVNFDKAEHDEVAKIKDIVKAAVNLTADGMVDVNSYVDATPAMLASAQAVSTTTTLGVSTAALGGHVREIAAGALALISLFMVTMMVKKGSAPPVPAGVATTSGPNIPFEASEQVAGEAGTAGALLDAMELDDESVKTQEIIGQVSTLVRENPDAAATLVKRWLNR